MKLIFLLLLSTSSLVLSKDFKANVGELKDPFEMNKFEGELIDPFDMETNAKEKLHDIKNLGKNPSGKSSSRKRSSTQENVTEDISFIYLKRIVNLLVHSPSVHGDNFNLKRVKFTLDTDTEDYKFLVAFASSKEVDAEKLRKLDTIISSLVHVPLTDYIADSLLSIQEKIWYMIADVKTLILCGVCVALYMVIHLFRTQHTMWYIIKYFLMFILVADYGQRYHMLLEEAEKQNLKNLSPECRDIGWFQNFFFGKHCENQKKFVTPLDVALSQLQSMIIIPLSSLGSGMGDFGKNLFESLPFPFNFLIFPMMLLFVIILVSVILTIMNGAPFRFNLLHLFHLEFGHRARNDNGNRIEGAAVNRLLEAVSHRPMMQDARSTPEKEKNKKHLKSKFKNQPKKLNSKYEKEKYCSCDTNVNAKNNTQSCNATKSCSSDTECSKTMFNEQANDTGNEGSKSNANSSNA